MSRTLRGLWGRRGTLLPLCLLTVVVTAGTVASLSLAGPTDTPWSLVIPLLLLGLVAVPATGRELASVRRGEIAVARLRGVVGAHLYALMAIEPLLVLVVGCVVGLGVGLVTAEITGRLLVEQASPELDPMLITAAVSILIVGLVGVLTGMAATLREPLNLQVSVAERPGRSSVWATFGHILVIVAALVGLYRSRAEAGDPDWVVLATPALVGLALGQIVVWLVQGSAAIAVRRTSHSGLTAWLTSRRLARVKDAVAPLRLVIAAAVVAGTSLSAAIQIGDYSDQTGRLEAVGPHQVAVEGSAQDAMRISHTLDPDGKWLMAAVYVPGEGSVQARRVFLDLARYPAVVGGFLDGTPFGHSVGALDRLPAGGQTLPSGATVQITVAGVSARAHGRLRPRVRLTLRGAHGLVRADATRPVGLDGAPVTVEVKVPECADGCEPVAIRAERSPGDRAVPWVISRLSLGGHDFTDLPWSPTGHLPPYGQRGPLATSEGLLLTASPRVQGADLPNQVGAPLPRIITAGHITWDDGSMIETTGGLDRDAEVVGSAGGLPMVVGAGLLADLPTILVGDQPTVPAAHVAVIAGADTPASVLDRLAVEAGHPVRSQDQYAAAAARQVGADRARVFTVMSLFGVLVSILVLGAAVSRQRRGLAREVAALRVVGISRDQVSAVGRRELLVLALASVLATLAGTALCIGTLIGRLPLVHVPANGLPDHFGIGWVPLLVAGLVAAGVCLVVGARGRRVGMTESRPAIMREAW